jgi:transketolase
VHSNHHVEGVEYSTGSLGVGLSYATGAALAARLNKKTHRVFVLLSDGECNEGSTWESVMFAAQHGLSNLTAIVDVNGQQAFGYTRDVMNLSPMNDRWTAFGWEVLEVDGHDVDALVRTLSAQPDSKRPRVVLARTVFGKGVSYMESQLKWHYSPLSEEQFQTALREIEK